MRECLDDPAEGSKFNDIRMQYVTHRLHEQIIQIVPNRIGIRDWESAAAWEKANPTLNKHMKGDKTIRKVQGQDGSNCPHKNDTFELPCITDRDEKLKLLLKGTLCGRRQSGVKSDR